MASLRDKVGSSMSVPARVSEDAPVGTRIATLLSSDDDVTSRSNRLAFRLLSVDGRDMTNASARYNSPGGNGDADPRDPDPASFFDLNRDTGALSISRLLDYENRQFHRVLVELTDNDYERPLVDIITVYV